MGRAELGVQEQEYLKSVVSVVRLVVGWNTRYGRTLRILISRFRTTQYLLVFRTNQHLLPFRKVFNFAELAPTRFATQIAPEIEDDHSWLERFLDMEEVTGRRFAAGESEFSFSHGSIPVGISPSSPPVYTARRPTPYPFTIAVIGKSTHLTKT